MSTLEDVWNVREQLSDESRWCKGRLAKTKDGSGTWPMNTDACQWCLAGAVAVACKYESYIYPPPEDSRVYQRFTEACQALEKHAGRDIETFNDAAKTEHQDVLNLLDKTIETLEEREDAV